MESDQSIVAKGVIGFWCANRNGDDIVLWEGSARTTELARLFHLRQQHNRDAPNLCLSDFIAPAPIPDFLGGFVVSVDSKSNPDAIADDYEKIMTQALLDRLVEGFAEYLHMRVRTEYWGYVPNERLSNDELIGEQYTGIRPAPGYPACPDHQEKETLFSLLDATGVTSASLTENYAMLPASTIAGWYFSHPRSQYFPVHRIQDDQLEDYAIRRGITPSEAKKWLSFSAPD